MIGARPSWDPSAYAEWLGCIRSDPTGYLGVPQYRWPLRAYKVSPAVNKAKDNDHPGLIEPLAETEKAVDGSRPIGTSGG